MAHSSKSHKKLSILPFKARMCDDFAQVTRGSWGRSCWCIYPRLRDSQQRELPGDGPLRERRRDELMRLARRKVAPGLVAYDGDEPVGWIAVAPRKDLQRVNTSRATPAFDELPVWVIPCITVSKSARGRGIGVELIRAAAEYAAKHKAPAVEAYPRAGTKRMSDDSVFYGTEVLFERAGFSQVRGPLPGLPRNWSPRVTMRLDLRR